MGINIGLSLSIGMFMLAYSNGDFARAGFATLGALVGCLLVDLVYPPTPPEE